MRHSPLSQGPNGKFISYGEAVHAWLPEMMSHCYSDPFENVLNILAAQCLNRASKEYKNASDNILHPDGIQHAKRCSEIAENWVQKRQIILETIEKIKALK
jgi:hypothetical protein